MKFFIRTFLFICLINFPCTLLSQNYKSLEKWIGNKALHKINGKTYFAKADELLSFKKVIPHDVYSYLTGNYFVYSTIEKIDSFMVTTRCRPHCCPCENLWLAIKINSDKYLCVYHGIDDSGNVVHCYGRGLRIAQLADSLKEDLILTTGSAIKYDDNDNVYLRNRWIDTVGTIY